MVVHFGRFFLMGNLFTTFDRKKGLHPSFFQNESYLEKIVGKDDRLLLLLDGFCPCWMYPPCL